VWPAPCDQHIIGQRATCVARNRRREDVSGQSGRKQGGASRGGEDEWEDSRNEPAVHQSLLAIDAGRERPCCVT
jgi:hypothetical protein